jgi:hypothetical protein
MCVGQRRIKGKRVGGAGSSDREQVARGGDGCGNGLDQIDDVAGGEAGQDGQELGRRIELQGATAGGKIYRFGRNRPDPDFQAGAGGDIDCAGAGD